MTGSRKERPPRRRAVLVATWASLACLPLFRPMAVAGDCTSTIFAANRDRPGDLVELEGKSGLPKGVLKKAVALWEQCAGYGLDFPAFVRDSRSDLALTPVRKLTVEYHPRSHSSVCGRFLGNEVHLYGFASDTGGRLRPCGPPELLLAHELGHVLGLADAPKETGCHEHVMSFVNELNRHDRRVQASECRAAGQVWLTAAERQAAPRPEAHQDESPGRSEPQSGRAAHSEAWRPPSALTPQTKEGGSS